MLVIDNDRSFRTGDAGRDRSGCRQRRGADKECPAGASQDRCIGTLPWRCRGMRLGQRREFQRACTRKQRGRAKRDRWHRLEKRGILHKSLWKSMPCRRRTRRPSSARRGARRVPNPDQRPPDPAWTGGRPANGERCDERRLRTSWRSTEDISNVRSFARARFIRVLQHRILTSRTFVARQLRGLAYGSRMQSTRRAIDPRLESETCTTRIEPTANKRTKPREKVMQTYQPATPRVLAGCAALAMTILTLSVSILAPATVRTEQQDAIVSSSTLPEDHTFTNSGPLVTSIDVVAYRRARLAPVVHKQALLRHDLVG